MNESSSPASASASAPALSVETLRAWDDACVWHPFTPMSAYVEESAPLITDADGFELIDADGRRYLDGISSLWCNVHGHRVPAIDNALRRQLDRVAHTTLLGLSSESSIRLAKELVNRTPESLTRVFFSDSGATSVEVALKLAYQFHRQKPGGPEDRDTFLCVGNAYHGDTLGTVSVGGIDLFHRCYRHLLFPTIAVPSPVATRVPAGHTRSSWLQHCHDEAEQVLHKHHQRAAGFVMEPLVQGAAGILVHPPGYLAHIRRLCTQYRVPLIADEVAVGFGRTGTMFACDQEAVQPDLMCLAKGITGGYLPLAATLATEEIYSAFLGRPAEGRTFFHGHTYTGNPLGCAAALASLELFDRNDVLRNADVSAEIMKSRLQELTDHKHVLEVRQKGIMVGIELVSDRSTSLPFSADLRIGHQVTLAARKRGVIIRPLGDVIVLMPAPAMPGHLIHRLCDAAIEAIQEVTANAGRTR
ncbi:MAG: adenosylmethionine--8-amino-7-oxononanoate transaminase [Planctomycetaceae bacterium]